MSTPSSTRSDSSSQATASFRVSSDITSILDLSQLSISHEREEAARVRTERDEAALDQIADQTLLQSRLEPDIDLISRRHGTVTFAQRANGEPLTLFVYVSGKQERGDYLRGGKFTAVLDKTPPVALYFLAVAKSRAFDVTMQFTDTRDVDFVISEFRRIGNPRLHPVPQVDLKVQAIAAAQYCNLLKRISNLHPDADIPTSLTLSRTFTTGYDGQILIQVLPIDARVHTMAIGEFTPAFNDLAYKIVGDILKDFGDVRAIKQIEDDAHHAVLMYLAELNQHDNVDHVVEFFRSNAQGITIDGCRIWMIPFNTGIRDPPFFNDMTIEEDNENHPLNAFRRRWHGEPRPKPRIPSNFFNPGYGNQAAPYHGPPRPNAGQRFDVKNNVDLKAVLDGIDCRSTFMFRNIPNRMSSESFTEFINTFAAHRADFIYLRKNFETSTKSDPPTLGLASKSMLTDLSVGYAFVNFIYPTDIVDFLKHAVGQYWPHSNQRVDVSYAAIQGRDALIEKFRNSAVMLAEDSHRPKLYYAGDSPYAGRREAFPPPNNQMKVFRSTQNAQTVGLFNGSRSRVRQGMYDRGNPRGEMQAMADENRVLRSQLQLALSHVGR